MNEAIAKAFDQAARILESQGVNPFRVRAYREGAKSLRSLERPVEEIAKSEGDKGLQRIPSIGPALAAAILQFVRNGRWGMLERLKGPSPDRLFQTIPGISADLAKRIHHDLGIHTLEELETAALDGTLLGISGIDEKTIQAVIGHMVEKFRPHIPEHASGRPPSVEEILEIDREFREKSSHDMLPRVAPRRFNPRYEAWLPVLRTRREHHHYTALYSNTARAHELGATHDWVVIREEHGGHGQWTVITSRYGPMKDRRVVRGREPECMEHYFGPIRHAG